LKTTNNFLLILAIAFSFLEASATERPSARDGGIVADANSLQNSRETWLNLVEAKRFYRIGYQAMLEGEFEKAIVYYVRCAKQSSTPQFCSDAIQVAITTKQNVNMTQSDIQNKRAKHLIFSGTYESANPKGNLRSVNPYSEEAKQIIDAYDKHYGGF